MTRITELARFPHVAECNLYVGEGSPIDDVERRIGSWISGCSPRLDLYAGVEQWLRREVGDSAGSSLSATVGFWSALRRRRRLLRSKRSWRCRFRLL